MLNPSACSEKWMCSAPWPPESTCGETTSASTPTQSRRPPGLRRGGCRSPGRAARPGDAAHDQDPEPGAEKASCQAGLGLQARHRRPVASLCMWATSTSGSARIRTPATRLPQSAATNTGVSVAMA